ncbi:hypothetical protein E6C50_01065 [Flavobacterium supellecticarium]|uniref:Zinc finger CHC2-type domain-containing protein n=1 Tax=Flavobacterium supellecticarium TaxID=2565924 RepID=A0A4S4A352_9FLAO|nr:toprim domain-containing protein [Flavobacterium supellecticarium]THF52831.1 hypothetical protein E6C50_01065 [Flavobacterium supellecticarium]
MQIETAKRIPLAQILAKLNLYPAKQTENESWYLSPFRSEKSASFHVHNHKNLWFDFGEGKGGDTISLVQAILQLLGQDDSVSAALQWLDNSIDSTIEYSPPLAREQEEQPPALTLKSVSPIKNIALKHYTEQRGIPLTVAEKFLKQVSFVNQNTGKTIFALGLQNEDEGYEIRNSFFKGCIGKKNISFIRGIDNKPPKGINVFEGMFDYLSVITQRNGKLLKSDTIILNSLSCMKLIKPYVKSYGYKFGYSWLDNDLAGKKATPQLIDIFKQENIAFCPMNSLYKPYKDVNAAHMAKLEL